MIPIKQVLRSSVGKKFIMAGTGLGLVIFLILHLLGNLLLYVPGGVAFNEYAHKLHSFGALTLLGEVGLVGVIFIHAVLAIKIKLSNMSARPEGYGKYVTKGGPSKWNLASVNMAVTGVLLLAFIVLHIWHLRFGPAIEQGYSTLVNGAPSRDLYRLVFESFKNPMFVGIYCSAMIFVGFHLRHGFWSAFQSLGLMRPRFSAAIYTLGLLLALILAAGFFGIPLYIYFVLPGALV